MIQLPDKQLFRPDEVTELMRIKSVETVHGWIRAGKIDSCESAQTRG